MSLVISRIAKFLLPVSFIIFFGCAILFNRTLQKVPRYDLTLCKKRHDNLSVLEIKGEKICLSRTDAQRINILSYGGDGGAGVFGISLLFLIYARKRLGIRG